jgi:hypothetical protein
MAVQFLVAYGTARPRVLVFHNPVFAALVIPKGFSPEESAFIHAPFSTHFASTSTTNVSGRIVRRGCGLSAVGSGSGPNFAVTV